MQENSDMVGIPLGKLPVLQRNCVYSRSTFDDPGPRRVRITETGFERIECVCSELCFFVF